MRRSRGAWVSLLSLVLVAGAACGVAAAGESSQWLVPHFREVVFDATQAEVTTVALPLTDTITPRRAGKSFQVPCGTAAAWRVTLKVVNNGATAIRGAVVEDEFCSDVTAQVGKPTHGTVKLTAEPSGRARLTWSIGDLSAKGAAECAVVVSVKMQEPHQGLRSMGAYGIDSGARLAYMQDGVKVSAVSERVTVTALAPSHATLAPPPLKGPAFALPAALGVAALVAGSPSADRVGDVNGTVDFRQVFTPLSPLIFEAPAHDGYPEGFEVPANTRVEWRVTITVKNRLSSSITQVSVEENFGAELEVDEGTVSVTPLRQSDPGATPPYSTVTFIRLGNEQLTWRISSLDPGQTATLSFNVYTRVNEGGHQEYSSCGEVEYLNSAPTLKYCTDSQQSAELSPTPVWPRCGGFLRVTVNTTELNWQIRKPGSFMTEPIELRVLSNRPVVLSCSGFADLSSQAPEAGYMIPTYYMISETQPGPGLSGWTRAADLSGAQVETTAAQAGTWVTWRLWSALEVGAKTRAAQYVDTGTLTFTMRESEPYIEVSAPAAFEEATKLQVPQF